MQDLFLSKVFWLMRKLKSLSLMCMVQMQRGIGIAFVLNCKALDVGAQLFGAWGEISICQKEEVGVIQGVWWPSWISLIGMN